MLKPSEHVDWVDRRNNCDAESISLVLFERVRKDIDRVNRSRPSDKQMVMDGDSERFEVNCEDKFHGKSVRFHRSADQIDFRMEGEPKRIIKWTWRHADASCQLLLDGVETELWQISQAALYDLFFPQG